MGRELVIFLAEYLIKSYGQIERITKLVNTTDIWLMPSLNPDGFAAAEEGHCYQSDQNGGRGRANANNEDLNRNFPDQFHDGKGHFLSDDSCSPKIQNKNVHDKLLTFDLFKAIQHPF